MNLEISQSFFLCGKLKYTHREEAVFSYILPQYSNGILVVKCLFLLQVKNTYTYRVPLLSKRQCLFLLANIL